MARIWAEKNEWATAAASALIRSYGLQQEFIKVHRPQQNGMIERLMRSLKSQCVHRDRFESLAHTTRAMGDWIQFQNHRRSRESVAYHRVAHI